MRDVLLPVEVLSLTEVVTLRGPCVRKNVRKTEIAFRTQKVSKSHCIFDKTKEALCFEETYRLYIGAFPRRRKKRLAQRRHLIDDCERIRVFAPVV